MNNKNQLNEVLSLIDRMENPRTGWENLINEVSCKWRMVAGPEDFYNILTSVSDGQRVTFGYISTAKVEIPKGKRLNPETKRMNQFDDYETFGRNLGFEDDIVTGIFKLSIYNFPWQTEDKVSNAYDEFKKNRNSLASKYGIEVGSSKYKTQNLNYGDKGGVSSYNGSNQDLAGHTYTNLNTYNIRPIKTSYYLIFASGKIQEIDESKLVKLPYKPSETIIEKLLNAGATEEEVSSLRTMNYQKFEHSHLLFFSATVDELPIVYINTKLSDKIGNITDVNPEQIIQLAKDRYQKVTSVNL